MKESQLYINFFKQNRFTILTPIVISLLSALIYILVQPTLYQATTLFEISNSKMSVSDMQVNVNQAVENLRSEVIQNALKLQDLSSVDVYKNGDLAVAVDISSMNKSAIRQDEQQVSQYITQKFDLQQSGDWVMHSTKKDGLLIFLIALFVGVSIGISISLIRSYLRNY